MAQLGDIVSSLEAACRYFAEYEDDLKVLELKNLAGSDNFLGMCARFIAPFLKLYKDGRLVFIDRAGKGVRLGAAMTEVPVDMLLKRWAALSDLGGTDNIAEPGENADNGFDEEARELFLARLKG